MLSVELNNLADIVDSAKLFKNVSKLAREWSSRIEAAVWNTTVGGCEIRDSIHQTNGAFKVVNNIFAYETNGLFAFN
jgi:uncharacterized protein